MHDAHAVAIRRSLRTTDRLGRGSVTPSRLLVLCLVLAGAMPAARPAEDAGVDDTGVTLPSDRTRERQFERARTLFAAGRWSDAATLCDELLAAPRDVFVRDPAETTTCRSLKGEVQRLLNAQPPRGREAYQLLCGSRAERMLREAVAADDRDAILTVARRWLATPAGRSAALIAALTSLEADEPNVAAAWLERLAATAAADGTAPLVAAMLAEARRGMGRSAGDGAWNGNRTAGDRGAAVAATLPLLAARYRVPLTRRPQDAELLEHRRRARLDVGLTALPAGGVVALDDLVLARTPEGVLASDFVTGKRLWMRPAAPANDDADGGFDDATSGGITAAGGLVFVIEGSPRREGVRRGGMDLQPGGSAGAGNSLVAYDVAAAGGRRWSLPAAGAEPAGTWFLGPPLAVDGDLYVLVEEKGEARLDVIDAATGTVTWTQPLAEIDEPLAVDHAGARGRRLAGLTPAVADGVLVCPLGVGTVMAVDLATRTLRWAFHYAIPADDGGADAGPTPFGPKTAGLPGLPRDSIPVIAAGRVLLTPRDCDDLVCLDLRSGSPAWADPPGGGLNVAGVVDDTVVVVGRNAVAALALADGSRRWELPWERVGGRPSGRGLLTPTSLLLPVDGPAVVEIGIADGGIRGRSVARGGAVPGNLVAHRGAVISRGLGTLDVFHQTASLQARLEAVEAEESESAWAAHWRGQLDLDRGHIAAGLALLKTAASSGGFGGGPETLSEAVIVGMRCDFATAAPAWRDVWQVEARRPGGPSSGARAVLRAAVDGFLQSGDLAAAWEPARELLAVDEPLIGDPPVPDPIDEALAVTEDRWLGGRLAELAIRGPEPLRHQIDAAVAAALARTVDGDGDVRLERLERLVGRLGNHPAAATVRQALLDEFDARLAAGRDTGAAARLSLRRDVLRLAFPASAAEPPAADDDWPLGRVTIDRSQATLPTEPEPGRSRRLPLAFTADRPFLPGIGLAHDLQHGCLLVLDGYGRRIAEPLAIDAGQLRLDLGWPPQSAGVEASCLGRMLFVRSGGAVSAYDLAADCGGRNLWTRSDGSAATRDPAGGWIRPLDGDAPEVGGLPLGLSMDAAEPAAVRVRGGGARISGVLHHDRRSLALLDPFSGCVAWERHGLPPASELVCDDDFVTICGRDGEESLVLSMQDGRLVRTLRLPPSRQRLGTFGRWIVATVPAADAVEDGAVGLRLEMIDPATAERQSLGDTAADSRAVLTGDRLLVIDRDGLLTAYDLARRRAAFEVRLPDVPQRVDFLQAIPWHDRLLVVAGSQGGDPAAAGAGSRRGSAGGGDRPAVDAAVWALDRSTGDPAWPVPATVAGMSLSAGQPPLVPTLVFHRHVARGGERQRLDLLALDKRTGHAVLAERGLVVHAGFTGAAVQGDPEAHAISVREAETGSRGFLVTYTGVPQPPQRPFQADREPGPHLGRFEGPLGPLPGNGRHPGTPMRRRP